MAPDEQWREALKVCPQGAPEKSRISTERAQLQAQAARRQADRAMAALHPDARLVASLQTNGVILNQATDNLAQRWEDTLLARNPFWSVGLQVTFPIERYAERAAVAQAVGQRDRLEALADLTRANEKVDWMMACSNLSRWSRLVEMNRGNLKAQLERVELDEARYRQGRVAPITVIQAGDDATNAEFALRNTELQARLAGWRVIQLSSQIKPYLTQWLKQEAE
jgi:outer membrane protein TolC